MSFPLAFLSLLTEICLGYPAPVFREIGHPVTWIGALVTALDKALNRDAHGDGRRRLAGIAALAILLAVAVLSGLLIEWLGSRISFGVIPVAVLASTLIAQRSLDSHVRAVATALDTGGLAAGRQAVSAIVGRDPDRLDEAGVCRAAIESLAENFSDGVVAPAFWLAAIGLPGGIAYKAVNTADSMIGHRSPRHLHFGWAAARFDDLVNLPASRLSALLIVLAALVVPSASAKAALRAVVRDARKHRSPNAGWPEAAMAGALGLSIAGPRYYHGQLASDAEMGAGGRREATASDIRRSLTLYRVADALLVLIVGSVAVFTWPM